VSTEALSSEGRSAGAVAEPTLEDADSAMARYADGDDAAFAIVYAALGPRILRFLRRLSGSDDAARDLFQETWIRLHQARGAFRPGSAVLPWSYAIARNCFLDRARSKKKLPVSLDAREHEGLAEASTGAEAESRVIAQETARAVEEALASMSEARREAFILVRFEGLSIAEAAAVLGASENAVKLRAFQAYEVLRAALERLEKKTPLRPKIS
jgi:RNA polymerase sigma-70 factor (ECF subfamily)